MQKNVPIGDGNNFDAALMDLDKYFAPKVCIGITRLKNFQRKQHKEEEVDDYVAELKKLAIDCKFGILHEDLIRDQLVMHARNQSIQERLWINGDAPLEDVLAIIRKAEISGRCATELKSSDKEDCSVLKINNRKSTSNYKERASEKTPTFNYKEKVDLRDKKCYRCGSKEHLAFSKSCPAAKQRCNNCGVVGHFGKAAAAPPGRTAGEAAASPGRAVGEATAVSKVAAPAAALFSGRALL
ncbi:hypothetical protein NDU88_005188 [Pleurodeles waltl]|uniref:Uncharacterized protein n=1 Tax=Pleurodeles waltl TaxID=8319 RepID=A0AAV7WAT2_PLEWA|nr:hypothetical protein NDU88_005188 [Pleurodeles waltl]